MKTSKAIKVKYSPVFEEQLRKLREAIKEKDSKFHNQLLRAIEREKDNLLIDMHRGIQVPKSQIPEEYVVQYGVTNLWKINLPDYWRMLYTIVGNEFEIISVLLEFMDHPQIKTMFLYVASWKKKGDAFKTRQKLRNLKGKKQYKNVDYCVLAHIQEPRLLINGQI